jgi:hypothetical protein
LNSRHSGHEVGTLPLDHGGRSPAPYENVEIGVREESLESGTVTCGHESRGTRPREWLLWRGSPAIVNDRPILSPDRMLHENYDRKSVSRGLAPRRTHWRETASS